MISGDNFQFGQKCTENSYYFSRYPPHIWGWASWERAWKLYDSEISTWPDFHKNGYLEDTLSEKRAVKYWESIFNSVYDGSINTWDYQWVFSCWIQGGVFQLLQIKILSQTLDFANRVHTLKKVVIFPTCPLVG